MIRNKVVSIQLRNMQVYQSNNTLQHWLRDQDQMLMKMGINPQTATDDQVIAALDKIDMLEKDHMCSLCLEHLEEPFFPCRCLFFKVHTTCLPESSYICFRCKTPYGGRFHEHVMSTNTLVDTRCLALTLNGRRCCHTKRSNNDLCHVHEKMRSRGRHLQLSIDGQQNINEAAT